MNFSIDRVPKKIDPCPILEAVVELRFEASLSEEVIPGLLFPSFKDEFPEIKQLPVTELPLNIRRSDPNLKFSPYYRFEGDKLTIQIGPRVFSVLCQKEYLGWETYSQQIKAAFEEIKKQNIVQSASRLGLRYINFFPNMDVFRKLKVNIMFDDQSLVGNSNILRTETTQGTFNCAVQLANNSQVNKDGKQFKGSTFDIDVSNTQGHLIMNDFVDLVNEAHEIEKKIFFSLLKDDYLQLLNPEY